MASNADSGARRGLGLLHDTATAGERGVALGFGIARLATRAGFGIASACIRAPAALVEHTVGPNPVSQGLRAADEVVGVAKEITHASQDAARFVTEGGLSLAKGGLSSMGAAEGESLRVALGDETGDVLLSAAGFVRGFAGPLRELPPGRLPKLLLAWSRLQAAAKVGAPKHAATARAALPDHAERLLRYSAAAYGAPLLDAEELGDLEHLEPGLRSLALAGLSGSRLLAFQEVAELHAPAYLLAKDEELGVVLAVRGTSSLKDALTDAACESVPVSLGGREGLAHGGMLRAARRLGAELLPQVQAALAELRADGREPALLLTGHSLGAGVASLLTALWHDEGHFSGIELRCLALAGPQVLDAELAAREAARTTTLVQGDDVVPRFGHASAEELRKALLLLHSPEEQGFPAFSADRLGSETEERLSELHAVVSSRVVVSERPLCAAGRLLHAREELQEVAQSSFGSILVSGDMVSDHLLRRYLTAVRRLTAHREA